MTKQTNNRELITIYTQHYFDGENSIKDLIKPFKLDCWGFIELEGSTMETLQENKLFDYEQAKPILNAKYQIELETDFPETIVGFQFYSDQSKDAIIDMLYKIAIDIESTSSGDDSFFDYDPDTIEAISRLIIKLGNPTKAQELCDLLQTKGHYD